MNYREKLREYIKCPQLGSIDYGKWGALNLEQRKLIKRLLDEMDRADEVIKKQFFELNKYKEVLDKIKNYLEEPNRDNFDFSKAKILEMIEELYE